MLGAIMADVLIAVPLLIAFALLAQMALRLFGDRIESKVRAKGPLKPMTEMEVVLEALPLERRRRLLAEWEPRFDVSPAGEDAGAEYARIIARIARLNEIISDGTSWDAWLEAEHRERRALVRRAAALPRKLLGLPS